MSRPFLTPIDMTQNEIQNVLLQNLGSNPGSPGSGQIWFDTGVDRPRWYSGAAFVDIYPFDTANTASTGVLRDSSGDFSAHDITANKVTGLAAPSAGSDAANKTYVDNALSGLDVKDSVRVATVAAGTLATDFENGDTIDGVVLATGDRILIKDQADETANGIYVVAAAGAPTRATDADSGAELAGGLFVFVREGTVNADTGWVGTHNGEPTLGVTDITFSQFSASATLDAGAGLTKTGNVLDVVGTADRITVSADAVDIASTYVGQSSITTLGTITTGTWNGTTIAIANGGTGQITKTAAFDALSPTSTLGDVIYHDGSDNVRLAGNTTAAKQFLTQTGNGSVSAAPAWAALASSDLPSGTAKKYAEDVGDGSATSYVITHNLNTRDVQVSLRDNSSPWAFVEADYEATSVNTVTVRFSVAPTAAKYRIIIVG